MRGKLSPHLQEVLGKSEPNGDGTDGDRGLPSPTVGEYVAYGPPPNKHLVSVHFITPEGCVRSFQYRHLDSDTRFDHQQITLRFLGFRPTAVIIEGQHLWQLYDYLHQNRMPWVMQATRDFPKEGQPFISKLTFVDMSEGES